MKNSVKVENSNGKVNIAVELLSWAEAVLAAFIIVAVIYTFFFRMVTVVGPSMEDTLQWGDKLITASYVKEFERGDIVTIHRKDDTDLIKRVIAIEGDRLDIDFEKGIVYLNGEPLDEPYIKEATSLEEDFDGEVTVPPGHLFVMGDNRNNSDDSRDIKIGFVDQKNVFGKVIFRIFPFDRFGKVE